MSASENAAPQEAPAWGPWAALAIPGAAFLSGALGWTGRIARHLDFGAAGPGLALAFLALAPLAFYAIALERGKAAPALRTPQAPWVLAGLLTLCVGLSGGTASPLWAIYPLAFIAIARNAKPANAVLLTLTVTGLEALPFARGLSPLWPLGSALITPVCGLGLGLLIRPEPAERRRSGGEAGEARAFTAAPRRPAASPERLKEEPLPVNLPRGAEVPDPRGLLQRDLEASLDLAFHTHPEWNAVSLWWGDSKGASLEFIRMRQGEARSAATVRPGEGLLGLALRERKPLNVEPLAPGAAAGLPYAGPGYQTGSLRVLPLSDEGRIIGLLACDKAGPTFDPDEAAALDALARALVQHAQRAAYLDRLRIAGLRTQKLYAAAQSLSAELERDALLERFAALLADLVPSDSWVLGMRSDDQEELKRLASAGYRPAPGGAPDRSLALAESLAESEGAVVFDGDHGAQVPAALLEGVEGTPRHFLLAPLRLGGRFGGVLKLDRENGGFTEEEREAVFIFANQAAFILEHARLYAQHRLMATTDGLTGLYNHRYFQERLALELEKARRTGRPLSVALTDIDFFKKFNDTFGHQEGDVVLRKVADMVKETVRNDRDVVCRYGGEEFVAILPDCDVVEARQVADRVRAFCADRLVGGSGPEARPITLSIGVSTFPAAAKEQRDLIHVADEALYKAKHTGRNRVCSFKDL
jgi:diguanylate cyclase (GGDEF)-like protein